MRLQRALFAAIQPQTARAGEFLMRTGFQHSLHEFERDAADAARVRCIAGEVNLMRFVLFEDLLQRIDIRLRALEAAVTARLIKWQVREEDVIIRKAERVRRIAQFTAEDELLQISQQQRVLTELAFGLELGERVFGIGRLRFPIAGLGGV